MALCMYSVSTTHIYGIHRSTATSIANLHIVQSWDRVESNGENLLHILQRKIRNAISIGPMHKALGEQSVQRLNLKFILHFAAGNPVDMLCAEREIRT